MQLPFIIHESYTGEECDPDNVDEIENLMKCYDRRSSNDNDIALIKVNIIFNKILFHIAQYLSINFLIS